MKYKHLVDEYLREGGRVLVCPPCRFSDGVKKTTWQAPNSVKKKNRLLEVRRRMKQGEAPDAIARSMRISKRTMETYLKEIPPL
jgi:DNA-binding NarL/FixJ family response regulator